MQHEWIAALFVAAVISVVHHRLEWLSAIEAYAYAALSSGAAVDFPRIPFLPDADGAQKALVILLDSKEIEGRYQDQSPLNRCALRDDLDAVYRLMDARNRLVKPRDGKPAATGLAPMDVLVIDLDLSTPLALMQAADNAIAPGAYPGPFNDAKDCQKQIEQMILKHAGTALDPNESPFQIRTVLMRPIPFVDPELVAKQRQWMKDMTGIRFGDARLSEQYGILLSQGCDPDALAAKAYHVVDESESACIGAAREEHPDRTNAQWDPNDIGDTRHRELINPRRYRTGLVEMSMSQICGLVGCCRPTKVGKADPNQCIPGQTAYDANPRGIPDEPFKAVFFGAGAGQADQVLTPLGERYGVEVHAVGLLTLLKPVSPGDDLMKLIVDVAFALMFGCGASFCWRRYLHAKSGDKPFAFLWVVALVGGVLGLALVTSFVSLALLFYFGLWASPILVGVGMLFDGFMRAPVVEALHVPHAPSARGHHRPQRSDFGHFIFRGAVAHFRHGNYKVASLFLVRAIVFLSVIVWALKGSH